MRVASIAFCLLLAADTLHAADPVYLDELVETPLQSLQSLFPGLRKDGCYRIGEDRWLLINIETKRDRKPWRVALTAVEPCRRADTGPPIDVRERSGIQIGDSTVRVVELRGRPDAAAAPESALRRLGETEYFYICRVEEGCARHTSFYIRDGIVTGIAEWYSQ